MADRAPLHRIPRAEAEMRAALRAACQGRWRMCVPAQADDHDMVISDAITELLDLRAMNARLCAMLREFAGGPDSLFPELGDTEATADVQVRARALLQEVTHA